MFTLLQATKERLFFAAGTLRSLDGAVSLDLVLTNKKNSLLFLPIYYFFLTFLLVAGVTFVTNESSLRLIPSLVVTSGGG